MSQETRRTRRAGRVVLELYREYDPQVAKHADRLGVTCKVGCSHCCMLPATATVPEMVLVVEHLAARADWPARRPQLERAINHHLREFAGVNILNERERAAFFTRQLPCVFLKDHRCEIYAVRPAVCRYHMVASPPENCALGAANTETALLDLRKLEHKIALKGADALGELTGGPIAVAFVLAADRLGVPLHIDRSLMPNVMVVEITADEAAPINKLIASEVDR
jgi:Fe-S-cluster containining protein